jgi:hypothetical protein
MGDQGVGVSGVSELNQIIQAFNENNAGKLTPAAQGRFLSSSASSSLLYSTPLAFK